MPTHLDLEEAMAISEMAFLPCRGITDADASDASYALRVEDETGAALLTIAHVARSQYSDPVHLAGLLEQARLELSKDGIQLTPWSMPTQSGASPSR
ncbi:hypothetical protein PSJM300_09030 [Stutzerimonas stutzeri DSM 10701]|uniref:hypothetical protein n=2 Tax=Stutzerimonas nitrititolerans TaxID=2482751 RepID=UPI00026D6EED|nr:hypothetical protein [Stutzerimonas nitrititolerans]AFN77874.1 hypothetical protein PSJM300_09030 [Stutzerimonas stutzeri DSM 10701]